MKKLLTITLMLAFSAMTFAQDGSTKQKKTPEDIAKRKTEKLAAQLDLSDEQKDKVYELNLSAVKDKQELNATYKDKPDADRKEASDAARKDYTASLKEILTEPQMRKYYEYKASKRQ